MYELFNILGHSQIGVGGVMRTISVITKVLRLSDNSRNEWCKVSTDERIDRSPEISGKNPVLLIQALTAMGRNSVLTDAPVVLLGAKEPVKNDQRCMILHTL